MAENPLDTNRTRQLKALAGQYEPANSQAASQQKAARDIQMQQAVAAAPSRGVGQIAPVAGALGAQQTATQVAQQAQRAQQVQAGLTQVGQLGLQQQGMDQRADLAKQQATSQNAYATIQRDLSNLNMNLSNKLLDSQLQFQRDATGRAVLNEQQLLDYAVVKAKNQQDLENYKQTVEQSWLKKQQMLKAAHAKIVQSLESGYMSEQQQLNNEQTKQLAEAKVAVEREMRESQIRAANQQAKLNAGASILTSIAGGVIGGLVAGPAGAAAGASVGGSVGPAIANIPGIRSQVTK